MNKELKNIFVKCRFNPNDAQKKAIETIKGPLLIIAGPGSGKTRVLIMRTLNLLLVQKVPPNRILLCTFTEKATEQLKERLRLELTKLNSKIDIFKLRIGTIHSICNELIQEFLEQTQLGKNYEVLEDLTQHLFIYEHFNEIFAGLKFPENGEPKWKSKWTAIKGIVPFLNKITEELIDIKNLGKSKSPFIRDLTKSYKRYEQKLVDQNMVDFAHLQKIVFNLLKDKNMESKIRERIDYIMVDEYQDTNYVQEKIMLELVKGHDNLCVVGDEDQSLYRFRGSTVRNILEFEKNFKKCNRVILDINYRSHKKIIELYNAFMEECDWSDENGHRFRFDKSIKPNPDRKYAGYPSTMAIWGQNLKDEANKIVDFIRFLQNKKIINDLNEVAILLRSVRPHYSGNYIKAVENAGLPYYCPRSREFFDNDEIKTLIGCYVFLFGFYGKEREEVKGYFFPEFYEYLNNSLECLTIKSIKNRAHPLAKYLRDIVKKISKITPRKGLGSLLDIFYQILAFPPFSKYLEDEEKARNLAIFSSILQIFQNYYGYPIIAKRWLIPMKRHLFNSYLKFLWEGGINEYEDPYDILPKDKIQIMTIHQSKGLEFPVVIVGSLDKRIGTGKQVDKYLEPFYHREEFEPLIKITQFDRMRLFYVAFARAREFLVLTCGTKPKDYFLPIWENLPEWPKVNKTAMNKVRAVPYERPDVKREFSLTSHINVYDTCPRQYQMYKEYEFSPSRAAQIFFGAIVHQTIEDIHKYILENHKSKIDRNLATEYFERNLNTLMKRGIHPLSQQHRQDALDHVLNYIKNNQDELHRIIETEVPITVEKGTYYLTGKIDLLLGEDGKLEVMDFKAQKRPIEPNDPRIKSNVKQLAIYAHVLDQKYDKKPDRLYVYWTGEDNKNKALMHIPIGSHDIDSAGRHFDEVVEKIRNKDFQVRTKPPTRICLDCDFRHNCRAREVQANAKI